MASFGALSQIRSAFSEHAWASAPAPHAPQPARRGEARRARGQRRHAPQERIVCHFSFQSPTVDPLERS